MHAKIMTKTKEEIKCRFFSGRESWGIGPSFCHLDSLSKKEKKQHLRSVMGHDNKCPI